MNPLRALGRSVRLLVVLLVVIPGGFAVAWVTGCAQALGRHWRGRRRRRAVAGARVQPCACGLVLDLRDGEAFLTNSGILHAPRECSRVDVWGAR